MQRILLKLSGESLGQAGIDAAATAAVAAQLATVASTGVQLAVVIGGGNIWRFRDNATAGSFLPRSQSDFLGMLATVMNGVALAAAVRAAGVAATAFAAVPAPEIAEPYSIAAAEKVLQTGGVAVLTGGTGRPFFTTDTAAALRAVELGCTRILKATTVDGVYDRDPRADPAAVKYDRLTFAEALAQKLGVLDATAFALLAEHAIPLTVFNFEVPGGLTRAAAGEAVGTLVTPI